MSSSSFAVFGSTGADTAAAADPHAGVALSGPLSSSSPQLRGAASASSFSVHHTDERSHSTSFAAPAPSSPAAAAGRASTTSTTAAAALPLHLQRSLHSSASGGSRSSSSYHSGGGGSGDLHHIHARLSSGGPHVLQFHQQQQNQHHHHHEQHQQQPVVEGGEEEQGSDRDRDGAGAGDDDGRSCNTSRSASSSLFNLPTSMVMMSGAGGAAASSRSATTATASDVGSSSRSHAGSSTSTNKKKNKKTTCSSSKKSNAGGGGSNNNALAAGFEAFLAEQQQQKHQSGHDHPLITSPLTLAASVVPVVNNNNNKNKNDVTRSKASNPPLPEHRTSISSSVVSGAPRNNTTSPSPSSSSQQQHQQLNRTRDHLSHGSSNNSAATTTTTTIAVHNDDIKKQKSGTSSQFPFSRSSNNNKGTINGGGTNATTTSVSIAVFLFVQCLVVGAVFGLLLGIVIGFADQQTRELVFGRINADLAATAQATFEPITRYETFQRTLRARVLASPDTYACSDESPLDYGRAAGFHRDGMSLVFEDPLVSYIYQIRVSTTHFRPMPDGTPYVYECDANRDDANRHHGQLLLFSNHQRATVSIANMEVMHGNLSRLLENPPYDHSVTNVDITDDQYVADAFEFPDVAWKSAAFVDDGGVTETLLSCYAALAVDAATNKTTWSIGLDVNMSDFKRVMRSVTPPTAGAHTSLYDMRLGLLLSSSRRALVLYNATDPDPDATPTLWPVGRTPDASVNDAFREASARAAGAASGEGVVFEAEAHVVSAVRVRRAGSGVDMLVVQSTPREYYFGAVERLRAVMLGAGCGAAALVVGICVAVACAVRRPLRAIQDQMELAAVMRNDEVDTSRRPLLSEMAALQAAFARMNAKLLYARAFMPQAMLCGAGGGGGSGDTDSDADDTDDEGALQLNTPRAGGGGGAVGRTHSRESMQSVSTRGGLQTRRGSRESMGGGGGGGRFDDSRSASHRYRGGGGATTQQLQQQQQVSTGPLTLKRVGVLAINIRRFHRGLDVTDTSGIAGSAADLVRAVTAVVTAQRGVVDSYHGDHFVVSFNAARSCAQAATRMCACALGVQAALAGTRFGGQSMGAAVGRAAVGQLGTETMRRFSIVGAAYGRAVRLERASRRLADREGSGGFAPAACLTDRGVEQDAETAYVFRPVGWLDPLSQQPLPLALARTAAAASRIGSMAEAVARTAGVKIEDGVGMHYGDHDKHEQQAAGQHHHHHLYGQSHSHTHHYSDALAEIDRLLRSAETSVKTTALGLTTTPALSEVAPLLSPPLLPTTAGGGGGGGGDTESLFSNASSAVLGGGGGGSIVSGVTGGGGSSGGGGGGLLRVLRVDPAACAPIAAFALEGSMDWLRGLHRDASEAAASLQQQHYHHHQQTTSGTMNGDGAVASRKRQAARAVIEQLLRHAPPPPQQIQTLLVRASTTPPLQTCCQGCARDAHRRAASEVVQQQNQQQHSRKNGGGGDGAIFSPLTSAALLANTINNNNQSSSTPSPSTSPALMAAFGSSVMFPSAGGPRGSGVLAAAAADEWLYELGAHAALHPFSATAAAIAELAACEAHMNVLTQCREARRAAAYLISRRQIAGSGNISEVVGGGDDSALATIVASSQRAVVQRATAAAARAVSAAEKLLADEGAFLRRCRLWRMSGGPPTVANRHPHPISSDSSSPSDLSLCEQCGRLKRRMMNSQTRSTTRKRRPSLLLYAKEENEEETLAFGADTRRFHQQRQAPEVALEKVEDEDTLSSLSEGDNDDEGCAARVSPKEDPQGMSAPLATPAMVHQQQHHERFLSSVVACLALGEAVQGHHRAARRLFRTTARRWHALKATEEEE